MSTKFKRRTLISAGIATAKVLFNLSTFLTKRDKWAGTFDELYVLPKLQEEHLLHHANVFRVLHLPQPDARRATQGLSHALAYRTTSSVSLDVPRMSQQRIFCNGAAATQ